MYISASHRRNTRIKEFTLFFLGDLYYMYQSTLVTKAWKRFR